jgi:hypothetical protein
MWPFDFDVDANTHTPAPGIEGGGADIRGRALVGGTGVQGGASGDVGYDPATGQASADGGAGGAFSLNLGPLGSVSVGGDLDGRASGDASSGGASGKALGFLSGDILGHNFNLSEKLSGGFSW